VADPEIGKLWVPESAAVVLDDLLTDVRLSMYQDGVTLPVTRGTDSYIWNTAFANGAMMLYAQLPGISRAANPLYATGKDLDDWRRWLGLPVVGASPSAGAVRLDVTGTASVVEGTQLVLPNGKRIKVSGNWLSVTDGDEVDVIAYDKGADTNAPRGTVVRFRTAPTNVATEAKVSYERPLSGGYDEEKEERKRTRVLNRLAYAASVSTCNWGGLRQLALDSMASVQDCFVYPALGGPASTKAVPVRGFDRDNHDYSRAFSSAAMALIRAYVQSKASDASQYVVQAPTEQELSVALGLTIPESRLAGGNGSGWVDPTPWPDPSSYPVWVTTAAGNPQITINAATTTAPVDGQTHIMWFSPSTQSFYQRRVLEHSGSTGAWVITLDAPLVDDEGTPVALLDLISPAAERADSYAKGWLNIMESLGCGENISGSAIAPRDSRRPYIADGSPRSGLTTVELLDFQRDNPEITDLEYLYSSASVPTVPGTIDDPPAIFVPNNFGIYKQ
jgi:uncharacterized phage protein gp47/JayE